MSNFIDIINADIRDALKEKNSFLVGNLRMLLAALKNKKIELGNKQELSDEEAQQVISSEIKKRKDSAESYRQGNREDLAEKEDREVEALIKYMPKQLTESEIEKVVQDVIETTDSPTASKFGQIMSEVMKRLKGKADGRIVGDILKRKLN